MSTQKIIKSNSTLTYVIALAAIIVAFMLLGGGPWIKEMMHGSLSINMANWKWAQILISIGIGFLLGIVFTKRRW